MTMRTVEVMTIQETARLLGEALGHSISWESFLDNCRNRGDVAPLGGLGGLRLLPVARMEGSRRPGGGLARRRPVYALESVREFIAEVRRLDPVRFGMGPVPVHAETIIVDTSIPWRLNVVGKPVRVSTSTASPAP